MYKTINQVTLIRKNKLILKMSLKTMEPEPKFKLYSMHSWGSVSPLPGIFADSISKSVNQRND